MSRIRLYSLGVIVAVAVAVIVSAFAGQGTDTVSGRIGGDFPAFYGAGSIVLDGDVASLYDPDVQEAAQADVGGDEPGFFYFAYPPPVALAYVPFAALPFRISFVLHTALMALALWAAFRMVAPLYPRLLGSPDHVLAATALGLLTYPVLRSIVGGQNTTLTLLLLACTARFLHDERFVAAGLAAALLLYKPQFGAVVLLLIVVSRSWTAVWAWAGGAAAFYAVAAVMLGPLWAVDWLDQVTDFDAANRAANPENVVSALGWWRVVVGSDAAALALAVATIVAVAAPLLLRVWRHGLGSATLPHIAASLPLVAGYTNYYDAGSAVLAPFHQEDRVPRLGVAVFLALSWLQLPAKRLGWSPLFLVLVALVIWVWRSRARSTASVHSDDRAPGDRSSATGERRRGEGP